MVVRSRGRFEFDGGAWSFFWVRFWATFVTVGSAGLLAPWGVSVYQRWRCQHTIIDGVRLRYTGSGWSLFGHYIKWWLLCVVTAGIYSFWLVPRMTRWVVAHQQWSAERAWLDERQGWR